MTNLSLPTTGYTSSVPGVSTPSFDPMQAVTGVLNDPKTSAMDRLYASMLGKQFSTPESTFLGMNQGTLQGLQGVGGMLSSLGSLYTGSQNLGLQRDAYNQQKKEYNRQVQKDKDFSAGIKASGLGSYSAGV